MKSKRSKWIGSLVFAAIAVGLAMYPFTPHGRGQVLAWAREKMSEAVGGPVEVEGFYWRWPLEAGCQRLRISDYFDAHDLRVRISIRALARRYIHIHWIQADQIFIGDWPRSTPTEHPSPPTSPPSRPRLTLKKLHIGRLQIGMENIDRLPAAAGTEIKRLAGERLDIQDGFAALTHHNGEGRVHISALVNSLPVQLSTSYRMHPNQLQLGEITIETGIFNVIGDFFVDWTGGQVREVQGQVQIEIPVLTPLFKAYQQDVNGSFRAHLQAEGQVAHLVAQINGLSTAWGQVRDGQLHLNVVNIFENPDIQMDLVLHEGEWGQVRAQELSLSGSGRADQWELAIEANGEWMDAWQLAGRSEVILQEGALRSLRLHQWQAQHGDLEIAMEGDAEWVRAEHGFQIRDLAVQIGAGRLTAHGTLGREQINLAARITDLPLGTFGFAGVPEAGGEMEGQLHIQGDPSNPAADLHLQFSGLKPGPRHAWDGPPAHFSAQAVLENRRVKSWCRLEGLTGRPVQLELDLPLALSLSPLHIDWPPTGPVWGRFAAETDLREVAALFVLDVHQLSGLCTVEMELSGTAENPELIGSLEIADGAYEHELTGTILRNVQIQVSAEREQIRVDQLSANDGDDGTLEARGTLYLLPDAAFPFDIALELDRFHLLHNDTVRANGRGSFAWQGNRWESLFRGDLTIFPMEIRIPERVPPALIDLPFTEINGRSAAPVEAPVPAPQNQHRLILEIDTAIPDRAFVRGRGLDSEWSGRMQIRGDARQPEVSGSLSILRGRFLFFGKRLAITRGIVTLDGGFPPMPFLDVVAESRSGGIHTFLTLTGSVVAPHIQLSSIPAMPDDEILSRLLFGREAARISPWQAITIAQAVNRLRGSGSAFDIMGETRRALRVDQIEIRESEAAAGDTLISVGKHLSDRVYVELERGIQSEGGRVQVEVELTPSIRLETEIGTDAEGGLGIIWLWDY